MSNIAGKKHGAAKGAAWFNLGAQIFNVGVSQMKSAPAIRHGERDRRSYTITSGAERRTEGEVAQHGETLKAHSRLFKDIEKRLRQVELESVKRSQEAVEEHPQTSQTEFIH